MLRKTFLLLLSICCASSLLGQTAAEGLGVFHAYIKGQSAIISPQNAADSAAIYSYWQGKRETTVATNTVDSSAYQFVSFDSTAQVTVNTSGLSSSTYTVTIKKQGAPEPLPEAVFDTTSFIAKHSNPGNTTLTYVFVVPLEDTTNVSRIRLKVGLSEGAGDLFDGAFVYDVSTSLPEGCAYTRDKKTVYIEVPASSAYNKKKFFAMSVEDQNSQVVTAKKYWKY